MAINSYDIVSTLQALGMMKYWKGKHIILKKQVCEIFIYYLLLNFLSFFSLCTYMFWVVNSDSELPIVDGGVTAELAKTQFS